jgi:hypothetical protein
MDDLAWEHCLGRLGRLDAVEAGDVSAQHLAYEAMVAAYRDPRRGPPDEQRCLKELRALGPTLKQRADNVLSYFERRRIQMTRPRPSTAAPSTFAAPPRLPQPHQLHRPIPARDRRASDHSYSLKCDEPVCRGPINAPLYRLRSCGASARRRQAPSALDPVGRRVVLQYRYRPPAAPPKITDLN